MDTFAPLERLEEEAAAAHAGAGQLTPTKDHGHGSPHKRAHCLVKFLSPVSGPVCGGTEVTITGQQFPAHGTPVVRFVVGGTVLSASARFVNDRTVLAVSPALESSLMVSNHFYSEVFLDFDVDGVLEPVGLYRLRPTFRYYISPVVLSIAPTCAQAGSDTPLQLSMFSDMWGTRGSKLWLSRSQLIVDNEWETLKVRFIRSEALSDDFLDALASGSSAAVRPETASNPPPPAQMMRNARHSQGLEKRDALGDPIVECRIPEDLRAGQYVVLVSLNNGKDYVGWRARAKPMLLSVYEAPQLHAIQPACAPVGATTLLRLTGEHFVDTGLVRIRFVREGGPEELTNGKVVSPTLIECQLPPGLDQSAFTVQLSLNDGVHFTTNIARFVVYEPLHFRTVLPKIGPAAGGTELRIYMHTTGTTMLPQDTGDITIRFLSQYGNQVIDEVRGVLANNGSFITCRTPVNERKNQFAEFLEPIDVLVAFDGLNYTLVDENFSYHSDIKLRLLTVRQGPTDGGTAIVATAVTRIDASIVREVDMRLIDSATGEHVDFTGVADATTSGIEVQCTTPAWPRDWMRGEPTLAVSLLISLNRADFSLPQTGTSARHSVFTYYHTPSVTQVRPVSGPTVGGTRIVISGDHLIDVSASEEPVVVAFVLNDGNSKHVEGRVEAGTIVAETPQWSCDRHISVAVLVSLNKQQFSSKPEATQYWRHFTYFFRPRIAAIAPNCGPISGGTKVAIYGDNLFETGEIRVVFALASGEKLVVDGQCNGEVVQCVSPRLPAGSAGQIVTVDLALNGSDYTGTKVSFEFYERVVLKSVHPPLTPWTVAVPITVRLSGLVASKHVLARLVFPFGDVRVGRSVNATVSSTGDSLHMTLPACTVLEPESLVPITASKVAGLLPLQVALDGQHYETVGNLLDADRGLRLYKPPAIRDISPHIVPATGRTVLALSSSEACFTVGPAALERVPRDDDDGCAVVADASSAEPMPSRWRGAGLQVRLTALGHDWTFVTRGVVRNSMTIEMETPPFARLLDAPIGKRQPANEKGSSSQASKGMAAQHSRSTNPASDKRDARRLSSAPPVSAAPPRRISSDVVECEVEISVDFEQFFSIGRTLSFYRIPVLASISPSVVDCGGGALLSVYGTGFLSDIRRCEPVVQIGDVIVQAVCVSPREIRCTAPPLPVGLQHIAISFNDGVTFHGPKKRTGSSQTSEAVTVRSVALRTMVTEPQRIITPVAGGSVVQVEVRTTLLKHHDALHVQFRGDNDQIQTVDATVASADKEKNVVVVACTTPRMLSACTASMHISVNGQEYSDTCSSRSIFHTPALAESTCPRHVPTFGGTNVRLLLVRPVQGIDPSSLHLVRCMVKLVATSDSKTTQEHLVEATLNSQNLGEIRFVAPPWPVADEVAVYVTLNGGDDWANSGGSIVYFLQPSELSDIYPTVGPESGGTQVDIYTKGRAMETDEILVLFHFLPEDITTFVTAQRTSAAMRAGRRRSLFQESRHALTAKQTKVVSVPGRFVQGKIRCKLPPHSLNHMMAVQVTVALNGIDCIGLDPRHPSVQSALTMTYYRSPVLTRLWPEILPTDGNAVLHLEGEFPSMVGIETVKVLVKQNGRSMVLDGRLEMGQISCRSPKMPVGVAHVEVSLEGQIFTNWTAEGKQRFAAADLEGERIVSNALMYYAPPFFLVDVVQGPTTGGTRLTLRGGQQLLVQLQKGREEYDALCESTAASPTKRPTARPALPSRMQSRLGEVPPDGYLFVRFEFDDGSTQTVRAEERPERDGTVDVACTTPTASRAGAARVQLLVGDPRYSTRVLKNETTFVFYSEPSLYSATPAVVSIFGDSRLLIAATVPHSLKDEPVTIRFQRVNEVETHLTTGFARNSITAKSELDTSRKPARRSDRDRDDDVMVFIECVTPQFMPRESAAADGHDREGDARNSSDSESGTSSTTSEEDWSDVDEEGTQGIVTPVDMGGDVYIAISFNRGENFHSLKPSSSERLKLALYRALVATDFQLVQTSVPVGDCGSPVRLCVGVVRSPNTRPLLPALATSSCALLRVTPLKRSETDFKSYQPCEAPVCCTATFTSDETTRSSGAASARDIAGTLCAVCPPLGLCAAIRVEVSLDLHNFIAVGELPALPHFALVHINPPQVNCLDTNDVALLCSAVAPLAPNGKRPPGLPRQFFVEFATNTDEAVCLPATLSAPRPDELESLNVKYLRPPNPTEALGRGLLSKAVICVDDLTMTMPRSAEATALLSLWDNELALVISCNGASKRVMVGRAIERTPPPAEARSLARANSFARGADSRAGSAPLGRQMSLRGGRLERSASKIIRMGSRLGAVAADPAGAPKAHGSDEGRQQDPPKRSLLRQMSRQKSTFTEASLNEASSENVSAFASEFPSAKDSKESGTRRGPLGRGISKRVMSIGRGLGGDANKPKPPALLARTGRSPSTLTNTVSGLVRSVSGLRRLGHKSAGVGRKSAAGLLHSVELTVRNQHTIELDLSQTLVTCSKNVLEISLVHVRQGVGFPTAISEVVASGQISLEWATDGTQHATAENRPRAIDCELTDTHRNSTTSLLHSATASVRVYVDQLDGSDSAASPAAAAAHAPAVASAPADSAAITTAASRLLELYAFRCHDIQKTLAGMEGEIVVRLMTAPREGQQLSSRRRLFTYNPKHWVIKTVVPDSARIERNMPIVLQGDGFARVSKLVVRFELDDGSQEDVRARLHDGQIFCTTPAVSIPQTAQISVSAGQGWWSKPVGFEFAPYPILEKISPPLLPQSTGGTLQITGQSFAVGDELCLSFYALVHEQPRDDAVLQRSNEVGGATGLVFGLSPNTLIKLDAYNTTQPPAGVPMSNRAAVVETTFSSETTVTCVVPPKLPVTKLRVLFSPTIKHTADVPTLDLFSLRSLAPDTGDNVGGTLIHINTFNLHRALSTRRQSAQARAESRPSVPTREAGSVDEGMEELPSRQFTDGELAGADAVVQFRWLSGKRVLQRALVPGYFAPSVESTAVASESVAIVECRTPACAINLLSGERNTINTLVDISMHGPEGPFTDDGLRFNYLRQPAIRRVAPTSDLLPGYSQVVLEGPSLTPHNPLQLRVMLQSSANAATAAAFGRTMKLGALNPVPSFDFSADGSELHLQLPFFPQHRFLLMEKLKLLCPGNAKSVKDSELVLWRHRIMPVLPYVTDTTSALPRGLGMRIARPSPPASGRPRVGRQMSLSGGDLRHGRAGAAARRSGLMTQNSDTPRRAGLVKQRSVIGDLESPRRGLVKRTPSIIDEQVPVGAHQSKARRTVLDPRQKENLYSFVNEISVEFSLNGHEWPERAMKRLRLNNPYVLRSIEPTSGPISGGTALAIHGDHFVETGQCCVGFLTRGRYAEPTKIRPSVFREELAISEQFLSQTWKSSKLRPALLRIQRWLRGASERKFSGALPCVVVPATVTSANTLTCVTPSVLRPGTVHVIVSFNGRDFEWVSAEHLADLWGANQTTAASSKDSSATPRDSRGDDDEELPTTARSGVGTTSTSLPGAGLAGARLHVSFEFYNVPRLSAIATRKDEIYTDHINVSGTGFVARGKVIVRFLKDASRAVNARPTKKLNDRSMKWPTEFDKFGKERPQAIDMVGLVLEPALITCATPAMLPPNSRCLVQLSLNSGHDFTEMMPFTVRNAPVLESVHPSCGTLTGGTPIKIRGRNFTDSSKICVRFRLPDEARATEGESPQHEFTTVDANCVDERTIEVELPPFDDVVQRTDQSDCVEEDTPPSGARGRAPDRPNAPTLALIDVCLVGGTCYTNRPLRFYLYDYVPKLQHVWPVAGPSYGGTIVHLLGEGFIRTNSITVRLLPLPTEDPASSARQAAAAAKVDGGAAVASARRDARASFEEPLVIEAKFVSAREVAFVMPKTKRVGRQLVQISLNGIEFSEPSRLTTFELYHDYASREKRSAESVDESGGGRDAWRRFQGQRRLREINFAAGPPSSRMSRHVASGNPRFVPNSHRPHRVAPDREALMSLVLEQVQEHGGVAPSLAFAKARRKRQPLAPHLVERVQDFFGQHGLAGPSADPERTLAAKLRSLCLDATTRTAVAEAFGAIFAGMDKPQLTYRDLCEGAIIQIWPWCTEWDLLELWSTIDPTNQGCVLLGDVVANLGGARPTSPSPGPARYSPLQAERLTMANKYQLPSMERVPMPLAAYSSASSLLSTAKES